MGNELKARLTKIDVDEIGFVDVPANEAEFVVVKSKEGSDMTKPHQADGAVEKTDNGNPEAGISSVPKTEAITKALTELQDLLKPETPAEEPTKPAEETEETPTPPETPVTPEAPETAPVEKADNPDNELLTLVKQIQGTLVTLSVSKGQTSETAEKGILSAGRAARLKKTIDDLRTLLNDLSPEGVTADQTQDVSGVVQKALSPLSDQLNAIGERLERLEGTIGVSKAIGGDSTDTPVKKSESVWSGLPL